MVKMFLETRAQTEHKTLRHQILFYYLEHVRFKHSGSVTVVLSHVSSKSDDGPRQSVKDETWKAVRGGKGKLNLWTCLTGCVLINNRISGSRG